MNVGKFHFVLNTVRNELEKNNLLSLLDQVRSSLSTSLAQQNSTTSDQFKSALNNFKLATDTCHSNSFTVSEHEVLEEIKAADFTGNGLYNNVLQTIIVNNLTPGDAILGLNQIFNNLTNFQATIKNIDDSFTALKIEYEEINSNQYQIGYLLPREITENTLKGLVNEFKSLDDLLITVKEIVSEEVASSKIRTISNSEFQVFLESTPAVIWFIISAVEKIITMSKSVLETKKIYDGMQNKSIPVEIVDKLQAHIDSSVTQGISKIAQALIEEHYTKDDQGRANELEVLLKRHLNYLADRIDRGATIEAKMGTPSEDETIIESDANSQLHLKIEQFKKLTLESTTSTRHVLQIESSVNYTD